MPKDPLNVLQETFGYSGFRGHQEAAIRHLIDSRDVLVLMPTGGGKSLCYQLPALIRPGTAVVISPLIALMQDQVAALRQLDIRAAYLNSSLDYAEQRDIEQQLLADELDLLYIAPERLTQPAMLDLLARITVSLFAIDEAHCVSRWGHDFRADYLQLNLLHQRFPDVPRIALTATADERTRAEIVQRLELQQAEQFVSSFDRPNIQYRITQKTNARRQLLSLLNGEHRRDAGIVYCLSRRKVEQVAEFLQQEGYNALPYHAGLDPAVRQENQRRFLQEEGLIIVATIAFGMGIDKPDVRFVAHLDLPRNLESYYQETGRAGRDGEPATAWMAYGIQDVIKIRQMLETSTGSEEFKRLERQKLEAMLGFCEVCSCRRQALLGYFGESSVEKCGNCDTCLDPVTTWDGTEAARKALSCVHRTGQKFGVGHLLDVLLGRDNQKVKQFGHQDLSVFGIGRDLAEQRWRSVFRQLIARGLLAVDYAGYGGLMLTETCRPVLRGETTLWLRQDTETAVKATRSERKRFVAEREEDRQLWEKLREKRTALAKEQGVPPYVIFHDATLMELVRLRPRDHYELAGVSGVGKAKLAHYGDEFLAVLSDFQVEVAGA